MGFKRFSTVLAVAALVAAAGAAGAQNKPRPKAAAAARAHPKPRPKAAARPAVSPATLAAGKIIYTKYCLTCHQADGGGVPNMNPPLIKTSYVLGDPARLSGIILNGFAEKVDINGETYNNIMPAHNFLSDEEIANLLTYVRNAFGNKASAITPAAVEAVRATNGK